jgi:hypothetical protein
MTPATDTLARFLEMFPNPLPILWVGAGASAAAGYPTLAKVEAYLRTRLPGATAATGFALIDEYVTEYGSTALENELETLLGPQLAPAGLHVSLARLAGAGRFAAVFTTNYDELIEDALKARRIRFVPQILQENFRLQARAELSVLKLHGGRTDWANVILSGESYRRFHATYPLLKNQLDLNLRVHPLLFVGCSMQDPRLLEWLRALPEPERKGLFPGRALITEGDWSTIAAPDQALLGSANIKPITVTTHADIGAVLQGVADKLAP